IPSGRDRDRDSLRTRNGAWRRASHGPRCRGCRKDVVRSCWSPLPTTVRLTLDRQIGIARPSASPGPTNAVRLPLRGFTADDRALLLVNDNRRGSGLSILEGRVAV